MPPQQQQQQYQDQNQGCHVEASNSTSNLACYQTYTPFQQNTWYNNNEYEHYTNMYDWNTDWNNHQQQASNTTISTDTTNTATSKSTATSPMLSSSEHYDYYPSYPTPPTPAGSTVSGNLL